MKSTRKPSTDTPPVAEIQAAPATSVSNSVVIEAMREAPSTEQGPDAVLPGVALGSLGLMGPALPGLQLVAQILEWFTGDQESEQEGAAAEVQRRAERNAALTPEGFAERAATDPEFASRLELARDLIDTGGSGTLSDGALVVEDLMKLPSDALTILRDQGTRVVVSRGSVTDYREDLEGVRPRGWPPGSSWDDVPGLNSSAANEVVIAIIGHGTEEGARVPQAGEGHGSYNLVLHEAMHAVDKNDTSRDSRSGGEGFTTARDADVGALSSYLAQAGGAGRSETYAEAAARYYGGDTTLEAELPELYDYFASGPLREPAPTTTD